MAVLTLALEAAAAFEPLERAAADAAVAAVASEPLLFKAEGNSIRG